LPNIRKGEYEGLSSKIHEPEWRPDYGPAEFKPTMGATATGARNILIAYNVNLDTDNKNLANKIAAKLRTSGILKKDDEGNKIYDSDGNVVRIPGRFKALQAAGWMYNEEIAQVSMNLLDYNLTGLHTVTDAIHEEAAKLGLSVTAGELVGLVPLNAMLAAGRFYNDNVATEDPTVLVDAAISGLQLDVLDSFHSDERIIEWAAGVN